MARSLKINPKYKDKVKLALKQNGFPNQNALALKLELARSTVANFLNGKPVDYSNFVLICETLGLDWQEIAAEFSESDNQDSSPSVSYFYQGYALLIGVGEFADSDAQAKWALPVTVKDIQAIHKVLVDPNFCAYPNNSQHIRLLRDREATRSAILDGLSWLKEQAEGDSEATVIVYYSGHGWFDQNQRRYYLVQHDINVTNLPASALSAEDFTNALRQIKAKRLLVIIDCCYAAGMATAKNLPSGFVPKAPPVDFIESLKQGEGRVVFTSSREDQLSWILPNGSMSLYTHHFIEALKGAANRPSDTVVTISNLVNHLNQKVPESARTLRKEQNPRIDWNGEDFPIASLKGGRSLVSTDSFFYVERPPIESDCYEAIVKPGALLRIKASQQMGKKWLMRRVLQYAREQGYETVTLSFEQADSRVFTDLETFSRWFCAAVSKELRQPNQLDSFWEDILSCNYNTTNYFQNYLLGTLASPLVLALDKVDLVFEHPEIAKDFCMLIRSWNDHANRDNHNSEIWQKLRLVIVHSTEVYRSVDINSSPLAGVGVVVDLPEFNVEQVNDLAQRYKVTWDTAEVEKLINLVGGHPYLVWLTIDYIQRQQASLDQLLPTAHTEAGIYREHLRQHLGHLKQHPDLARALREVVTTDEPVELERLQAFKLHRMGLVKLEGNKAKPRCELYRQYFRDSLKSI